MIGCELIPLHETNSYINQASKLQSTSQMYLYKWMVKDQKLGIFPPLARTEIFVLRLKIHVFGQ